jgi:hypothetical protein
LPYCPRCGNEVEENYRNCPNCGKKLGVPSGRARYDPSRRGATDHLSLGFSLALDKPMVFAPVLLGGIISSIIGIWVNAPLYQPTVSPVLLLAGLVSLIGSIIAFILNFASIDMARDAYLGDSLDLMGSVNYVVGRILTFITASIIGALMFMTIILIPVVILMFVIIVMDETGVVNAISQSFSVISKDLRDVIVILVVAIVGWLILFFIPYVGDLLYACLLVVLNLAFIDVYYHYRKTFQEEQA